MSPRARACASGTTATLTIGSETSTASVVLAGSGTAVWHTDSWTQTAAARDILVAMGGSSGMIHRSPGAFSELELLLATVLEAGTDVRLSMVTEDDGCIPEPVYIDAATTNPDEVLASFCGELDGDRCTGTGSDQERGFTLLESALMAPCNGDWLREDADLALVSISDEGEHSVNPYTYYVALFQSLKDEPEYVRLHAVGGDYPTGCSDIAGYVRMYEATIATGGTFHSMCEEWGETLGAELADVSPRTLVALSHEPVPDSVSVIVDGTASTDWSRQDDWTIELDTPPDPGVEVLVTYRELPECP
ncbi:MAG: hypothetical protein GY913_30300 [Proteobacteria bacterium]|nr:hypothetical protein [Pseudomonadota bacterium]MCP4921210.1 hypothetical protein [Pseudomonadota bacterium]